MEIVMTALARPPEGVVMVRPQKLFEPVCFHRYRLVGWNEGLYDRLKKVFQKKIDNSPCGYKDNVQIPVITAKHQHKKTVSGTKPETVSSIGVK